MEKLISFHYVGLFTDNEEDITVYFCKDYFHIHHYKGVMNQGATNVFVGEAWYNRFMTSLEVGMKSFQMAIETYLDKIDSDMYDLMCGVV